MLIKCDHFAIQISNHLKITSCYMSVTPQKKKKEEEGLSRHTGCSAFSHIPSNDRKLIWKVLSGLIPAIPTRLGFRRSSTYPHPICGQWNLAQQHFFPGNLPFLFAMELWKCELSNFL